MFGSFLELLDFNRLAPLGACVTAPILAMAAMIRNGAKAFYRGGTRADWFELEQEYSGRNTQQAKSITTTMG